MKKGSVLMVVGIIILSLMVVAVGTGVYFYKFHAFKTLRVCIGNELNDTNVECSSTEFCINEVGKLSELQNEASEVPEFIVDKMEEIFERAIICEGTCKIKNVRGIENGFQEIEFCNPDEEEVKLEIHGKEGLELLQFVKSQTK